VVIAGVAAKVQNKHELRKLFREKAKNKGPAVMKQGYINIVESQGLIDRFDDLDSHSKSRNDSIEHSNTWGDISIIFE